MKRVESMTLLHWFDQNNFLKLLLLDDHFLTEIDPGEFNII